jgi:hypothetical protein
VYPCGECNFEFKKKDHLKRHQQLHEGSKPFDCKECPQTFARKVTIFVLPTCLVILFVMMYLTLSLSLTRLIGLLEETPKNPSARKAIYL